MSEPRILIAAGCSHSTVTRYRCIHLQEQMAAIGIAAEVQAWYGDNVDPKMPLPYDALVLQRVAMSHGLAAVIERMQATGKPVVFDTDDLVFEPQLTAWHRGVRNLPPAEQELYEQGVLRYRATLEACDSVLVATPLLAQLARRHGPPVYVHRNALGNEMTALAAQLYRIRQRSPDSGRLVLGYGSGTPTHDVDFEEIAPALVDILTRCPHVELWILGPLRMPEVLAVFGPRVRRFPLLEWHAFFELQTQFDINLAPLEMNNIFCRAKSEVKFLEASALGIPTVASRIDAFEDAVIHGKNGLLAGSLAEWIAALDQLVAQPVLRRQLGEAARCTVEERFSPGARANDLSSLLPALLAPRLSPLSGKHTATSDSRNGSMSAQTVSTQPASAPATPDVQPVKQASPAQNERFVPLTLNWLVTEPFPGSGGHTGIFRMLRHLVEFGHICHVYTIPVHFMQEYTSNQIEAYVANNFMSTGAIFHQWTGQTGEADASIATYWKTVPLLMKLPLSGRRYYLVQDFEPSFYPVGSEYILAENTYRQGLHCITLGPWLARFLREQYGAIADHFDFAVDTDTYLPIPAQRPGHPRVAFYARPSTPRRAYELGLEALRLVKQSQPGVEILCYGADKLVPPPPFPVSNMGILNPWELARLFSTCDAGVAFSTTNPSFVPFEMMACRCAVVDIRSERVAGLLEDGVNCRLAEPTPESIADTVLEILWNKTQREEIAERAYGQVISMSWRHSARQIEETLLRHAPAPEKRIAHRQLSGDDAEMLAWQIHQLLAAGGRDAALVDGLRDTLYRTLAEKAQMLQHVQQVEQAYLQRRQGARGQGARKVAQAVEDKVLAGTPGWLLGLAPVSKLALDHTPFVQQFQADRSHLCRIELLFARRYTIHTGLVRFTLYAGDVSGRVVTTHNLFAVDIGPDQPYAIDFPSEVDSYGQPYTFTLAAGEAGQQSPALWHFWQPQHAGAQLRHGNVPLMGQLAFQPFFRERTTLQPPRQGVAAWGQPVRLAPAVVRAVAVRGTQEGARLLNKTRDAIRSRGVGGLAREIMNYLDWQLNKGDN